MLLTSWRLESGLAAIYSPFPTQQFSPASPQARVALEFWPSCSDFFFHPTFLLGHYQHGDYGNAGPIELLGKNAWIWFVRLRFASEMANRQFWGLVNHPLGGDARLQFEPCQPFGQNPKRTIGQNLIAL
jgi:hypothetical protein